MKQAASHDVAAAGLRFACGLLVAAAAPASRAEFAVVRDGRPGCVVIAPTEPGPRLQAALDDFVRCVERISGARLPIVPGATPAAKPGTIRFLPSDGGDLPFNGFRMTIDADSVGIRAPREAGWVNALYTILQDDFGVRWYMPGDLFEIVPERPTLTVPGGVREGRPSFFWRVMGGNSAGGGTDWLRRNRLDNGVPDIPGWGFGHNVHRILPRARYAREHPEYYVFREGRWCIPGEQAWAIRQACFTNPDVARIGAEYAHRFFLENPGASQVSLSANDNNHYCECPDCAALDEPRPVYEDFRIYSESYFHWVKAVADRVAATDPDKTLGALAYWNTVVPPRRIERMPDNVVIVMTQDTCRHFDPAYRDRDRSITAEWTRKARTVARYDYGCLTWLTPKYYPKILADELNYLHRTGVHRYYIEADTHWPNAGPGMYMAARMLWDIREDPEALLGDCFASLYGEAAAGMAAYYAWLEQVWSAQRRGTWFHGFMNTLHEFEVWDPPKIRRAEELLEEALIAARTDPVRRRIDFVAQGLRFSSLLVGAHASAHALEPESFAAPEEFAGALRAISTTVDETLRHAEATFTAGNHYPQLEYRGERFQQKIDQWLGNIGETAAARLAEWIAPGKPDRRSAAVVDAFAAEHDPRVRGWVLAGLWRSEGTRALLAQKASSSPAVLRAVLEVRAAADTAPRRIAAEVCDALSGEQVEGICRAIAGDPSVSRDAARYASWQIVRSAVREGGAATVNSLDAFLARHPRGDTAPVGALRLALALEAARGGHAGRKAFESRLDSFDLDAAVRDMIGRMRSEAGFWRVCGPFPDPDLEGARTVFPPEADPHPARTHAVDDREMAWDLGPVPDASRFSDLQQVWGDLDRQAGYAQTFLFSPDDRDAVFWIGSDDGIVVWLGGERVHAAPDFRAAVEDEDRVPVRLRKGWNRIVLKILENEGGWGWFFRATDPDDGQIGGAFFAFAGEPEA